MEHEGAPFLILRVRVDRALCVQATGIVQPLHDLRGDLVTELLDLFQVTVDAQILKQLLLQVRLFQDFLTDWVKLLLIEYVAG